MVECDDNDMKNANEMWFCIVVVLFDGCEIRDCSGSSKSCETVPVMVVFYLLDEEKRSSPADFT